MPHEPSSFGFAVQLNVCSSSLVQYGLSRVTVAVESCSRTLYASAGSLTAGPRSALAVGSWAPPGSPPPVTSPPSLGPTPPLAHHPLAGAAPISRPATTATPAAQRRNRLTGSAPRARSRD